MSRMDTIDHLSQIPEDASFPDLREMFQTGRSVRGLDGKRDIGYRHGVMTELGDVEKSVWREAMIRLIDRSGERELFELLTDFVLGFGWFNNWSRTSMEDAEMYALQLHSSRIFENEEWVCYQDFRLKMLEAGLVQALIPADPTVSVSLEEFFMEGSP